MSSLLQRVSVVCYDRLEFEGCQALLRKQQVLGLPGCKSPLVRGVLEGSPVSLLRLPFGDKPQELAQNLQQLLTLEKPALLLSLGTAMTCRPAEHAIGDLFITSRAIFGTDSVRFVENLIRELEQSIRHDLKIRRGVTITSSRFIDSPTELDRCLRLFPEADTIEMEDFHLGRAGLAFGVPAVSLRAISDSGSFKQHMEHLPKLVSLLTLCLRRFLRQRRTKAFLTCLPNSTTADFPFALTIEKPGIALTIPEAFACARRCIAGFQLANFLSPGARVHITIETATETSSAPCSRTGRGLFFEKAGLWRLAIDAQRDFADISCTEAFLQQSARALDDFEKLLPRVDEWPLPVRQEIRSFPSLPRLDAVHIQGLNSISAEAEEGLLAGPTIEEFRESDIRIVPSTEARVWVYRTAHAADESYFHPDYPTPMRHPGPVPPGCFLVATGLGPAIDPTSSGGGQADLLLAGDEQGGRLLQYLEEISSGSSFMLDTVFRYDGLAHRVAPDLVAISRFDRRYVLSEQGFNRLTFDPATLRSIYALDYDRFLKSYFPNRRSTPPAGSALFMTSRGCGNECSICCSGGYQPFAALTPEHLVDYLRHLKGLHQLADNQYLDVFLLDSNFNKQPHRIIRLAELLERHDLGRFFEFFVRHSSIEGFLRRSHSPLGEINVHTELIEAYHRLHIDEIVIGVDSYTDASVKLLKTSITRLRHQGNSASPSYTFAEIQAVLKAIDQHGLKSRCFLLMNNPFTCDEDRLETFYNLLQLAIEIPGFVIDYDSSTEVNELKPFPGAPLTRVARQVPGLIEGRRFARRATPGQIEPLLRFDPFKDRRPDTQRLGSFLASTQQVRFGLGDFLLSALKAPKAISGIPGSNSEPAHHLPREVVRDPCCPGSNSEPAHHLPLAGKFLLEETRIQPFIRTHLQISPFLADTESQIRTLCDKLRQEITSQGASSPHSGPEPIGGFFQLLDHLR